MCGGGGERTGEGAGAWRGLLSPGKGFKLPFKLPVPRSRNVARRRLGSTRGSRRWSSPVSCRPTGRAAGTCFRLCRICWGFLPPPRPRAPVRPKYHPITTTKPFVPDDICRDIIFGRYPRTISVSRGASVDLFSPRKRDAEVKKKTGAACSVHTAHAITGGCREPFAEIGSMWSSSSP